MAFPVDAARASYNGASSSSHAVTLPAGISAGDLLVMIFREGAGTTITTPAGWTILDGQDVDVINGVNDTTRVFYKKATGSEGASVSVGLSGNARACAITWRVTGAADPATTPPEHSVLAFAQNTTPDPASLTPSGGSKDYLWIWAGAWQGTQADTTAAFLFTNWVNAGSTGGGSISTHTRASGGSRQFTGSSLDPGAVSIDSSNDWAAWAIAVSPPAGGGGSALTKNLADTVTLSDAISRGWAAQKSFADTATLSDAIAKAPKHALSDTITLSDAITPLIIKVLQLADTITVTDSIAKKPTVGKADTVFLSDTIGKKPAIAKSDTITLSDAVAKRMGLTKTDSVFVTDTLAKAMGLSKADSVTVTDAFGRVWTIARALADTVTLSDSAAKAVGASRGDTVTLSDAFDFNLGVGSTGLTLNLADTVTLTDTLAKSITHPLADSVTMTDVVGKGITHPLADTATITDAVAKRSTIAKADSVTLTDSLSKRITTALADTMTLADAVAKAVGTTVSDELTVADAFNILLNGESPFGNRPGRARFILINRPGLY